VCLNTVSEPLIPVSVLGRDKKLSMNIVQEISRMTKENSLKFNRGKF